MYSWPGVKFLLKGGSPPTVAGGPWLITSRSVAQMAVASTRTNTSAPPGTGIALSTSVKSPGLPSTHAFMVFDIFGFYHPFFGLRKAPRYRYPRIARVYIIFGHRTRGF